MEMFLEFRIKVEIKESELDQLKEDMEDYKDDLYNQGLFGDASIIDVTYQLYKPFITK